MKREWSGSRRNSSKQGGAQRYHNLTEISSLYQPFPIFRRFQAPYPRSYHHDFRQLRFPKVSSLTSPRSPTFASPEVSPKNRKIIKFRSGPGFSHFFSVSRPEPVPKPYQFSISVPNAPISYCHFDFSADFGPKHCRKPVFDPFFRVQTPRRKKT